MHFDPTTVLGFTDINTWTSTLVYTNEDPNTTLPSNPPENQTTTMAWDAPADDAQSAWDAPDTSRDKMLAVQMQLSEVDHSMAEMKIEAGMEAEKRPPRKREYGTFLI
jgi:hypothetical protein